MGGRQACFPIQRCCCGCDMHIYKMVAYVEQALAVAPPPEHPEIWLFLTRLEWQDFLGRRLKNFNCP